MLTWKDIKDGDFSSPQFVNVAGVTFVEGYPDNLFAMVENLSSNRVFAKIVRNPDNEYDSNACQVWIEGQFVGHLPKDVAAEAAPEIDRGVPYAGEVVYIGASPDEPMRPGVKLRLFIEKEEM